MTKDQAAQLRAKWKEQGDLLPLCEHLIKELTDLVSRDAGVPMGAYHCRACGEDADKPVAKDFSPATSCTVKPPSRNLN